MTNLLFLVAVNALVTAASPKLTLLVSSTIGRRAQIPSEDDIMSLVQDYLNSMNCDTQQRAAFERYIESFADGFTFTDIFNLGCSDIYLNALPDREPQMIEAKAVMHREIDNFLAKKTRSLKQCTDSETKSLLSSVTAKARALKAESAKINSRNRVSIIRRCQAIFDDMATDAFLLTDTAGKVISEPLSKSFPTSRTGPFPMYKLIDLGKRLAKYSLVKVKVCSALCKPPASIPMTQHGVMDTLEVLANLQYFVIDGFNYGQPRIVTTRIFRGDITSLLDSYRESIDRCKELRKLIIAKETESSEAYLDLHREQIVKTLLAMEISRRIDKV